ncbi:hypothetical protein B0T26DRAFT_469634 [Lasiosphaeria miniovina]|uniref:Secreted protein n=1 Tax=Lasiosphaeria miniovina TaxID=1954250 RepID=A0AA40DK87_9PEZI|nr:uncharacterized protein B0T26DRAFT_469634 [Lasiosphaeria miniovina]KAK0706729.1 hypothetical protein B0T26DRAFT_469634 [Lasiosphaeria miniovina]
MANSMVVALVCSHLQLLMSNLCAAGQALAFLWAARGETQGHAPPKVPNRGASLTPPSLSRTSAGKKFGYRTRLDTSTLSSWARSVGQSPPQGQAGDLVIPGPPHFRSAIVMRDSGLISELGQLAFVDPVDRFGWWRWWW